MKLDEDRQAVKVQRSWGTKSHDEFRDVDGTTTWLLPRILLPKGSFFLSSLYRTMGIFLPWLPWSLYYDDTKEAAQPELPLTLYILSAIVIYYTFTD